jgi:hypothetical protein
MAPPAPDRRPRPLSPHWWVTAADGRVVVGQLPNPALYVWLAALLLRWSVLLGDENGTLLVGVGRGALIVWGADELFRGVNPLRRLLGLLVLAFQVPAVLLA